MSQLSCGQAAFLSDFSSPSDILNGFYKELFWVFRLVSVKVNSISGY